MSAVRSFRHSTGMSSRSHVISRGVLLAGVSALTLMTAPHASYAKPIGNWTAAPSAAAIAAAQSGSQEAARAARDANNALKRATLAIQAMQSTQAAARDAARAALNAMPSVPNGLTAGGLQIGTGVKLPDGSIDQNLWQGANLPTQFADGDRTKVDINQTQQKAILTWDTFNVGAKTDLNFNQHGNSNWVALNRVLDPNMAPSRILGNITADGSVYVINTNGIIFGGTSQVNVGTLIASTANISNDQFLTKGIYSTQTGNNYAPSFTGATGTITVEAGAQIQTRAPTSVTSGGGFVLLMGSSVDNAGIIATPNGQTMLAAGHDFVLRQGFGTEANIASTTRGNEIATGTWNGSAFTVGGGSVSNEGLIFSQQGDITLAGHSIAQNGILLSTTSVNQRGTIHLLNAASDTTGSITLGSNSITDVMLELDSDATALNSQRDALIAASSAANVQRAAAATGAFNNLSLLADRQDQSRIEIVTGGTVTFKNGSITLAQGGQVAASAGQRIFTESGSTIDVSGVRDVLLPMSANNIEVNVQGNELRDSPANRDNGFLANSDVWIDVRDLIFVPAGTGGYASDRYYTPGGLLEVSGYLANTAHKIGEWASVGGTITLSAPEVIAQQGSTFDISGGSVRYDSGNITTTNFLGSDGRLYNVNNADANMTFYGLGQGFIRKNERWGITEVWTSPFNRGRTTTQWEDGYTVGRDAGQLILSTPTSVFEGTILADVVTGTRQINARPEGVTDGYKLAQNTAALAGSLALGAYDATGFVGGADTSVVFGSGAASVTDGMHASDALPSDRSHTAYFDADLISSFGLGGVDIASNKSITVDARVNLAAGAQVTFAAPYVDINADITAHSGTVTLGNLIHSPPIPGQNIVWTALTDTDGKAQVTINAAIDLTGFWTNNSSNNSSDTSGLAYLDGGNLTVSTTGGITLAGGSIVDVSSGGSIIANRKTQGGKGGSVSLLTNDYSHFADTGLIGIDFSAQLVLDGSIRSYGFNGGGTLTLGAGQSVVIGNNAAGVTDPVLVISPDLFQSGFTSYDIRSFAGMTIADGTAISPVVPIYQFINASYGAPTGTNAANAASLWTPPTYLDNPAAGKLTQRVGADLTLSSLYDFNMKSGSAITVDPGRNVTIYANRQTTIDGRITAPGGNILVTSLQDVVYNGGQGLYAPTRSIWIGDDATLDVSARAVTGTNAQGMTYGVVPDGGSITLGGTGAKDGDGYLIASDTFVIVRPGALLDASGTSAVLDITSRGGTVPTQVASDGGTIALYSALGLYIDGTLRAASGGAGASGGTLILANVGHQYSPIPAGSNSPYGIGDIPAEMQKLRNITITQHQHQSGLASNLAPGQADPTLQIGNAAISVDQIHAGGFDALSLYTRDLFVFQGNVDLAMNRSITLSGGILSAAASTPHIAVNLSAPYVNLTGWNDLNTIVQAYYPGLNAVKGPSLNNADDSTFNVSANLIDISGKLYFGVHGHQGSGVVSAIDINHTVLDDTTDDNTHISGGDIIDAAGFKHVTLQSAGDVRFGSSTTTTPGDLTIQAAQLYPLSNASAMVNVGVVLPLNASGGIGIASTDLDTALTIRSNGGPAPDVPPSVFGKLVLLSAMIDQGGVVRAPLGAVLLNNNNGNNGFTPSSTTVIFRDGSITSASANGLTIPFGGTSDGITYQGADGTLFDLGYLESTNGTAVIVSGVSVLGTKIVGEKGAIIDLSGGGNLTGAGFVSGRGGSVDVLKTPLVNANPAYTYSSAGNKVYAILPGYASNYAPVIATNGAGNPIIGQQITIPAGVSGLPAGTYTLLPSSYALLPGAYRVEIGKAGTFATPPVGLPNGSVVTSGYLGIANTGVQDPLPTQLILTSGKAVRSYSQYNEMSYADFALSQAATFGAVRPRLPEDGKVLELLLGTSSGSGKLLTFEGTASFAGAGDGVAGSMFISTASTVGAIDITAPGAAPVAGHTSISSDDLNAFNAATLVIGGYSTCGNDTSRGTGARIYFSGSSTVNVLDGADVRAGQVFLVGKAINVAGGASIDTRDLGTTGVDSSLGYMFGNTVSEADNFGAQFAPAVLAVANGTFNFLSPVGPGSINVASGASLLTNGSIVLAAPGSLTMGDVNFGARYLTVTQDVINAGTSSALAAAAGHLPPGWNLTQAALDKLLQPSTTPGAPALEQLTLTVGSSFNLIGDIALDARGESGDVRFVINTPAIYGLGNGMADIKADTLIWNGIRTGNGQIGVGGVPYGSKAPGAVVAGGPGTGSGTLNIAAKDIIFGYDPTNSRVTDGATLDRLALGFTNVSISASDRILSNSDGTLQVGLSKDSSGNLVGGNLTLTTPLLTATGAATMAYNAGGAVRVVAPSSGAAQTIAITDLGGTVSFKGDSVFLDTAVALPSGKLTLSATNNIDLGANAAIDLSGRTATFFDVTKYSWGGNLILQSDHGNITQAVGSSIDVTAQNNDAGTITATAADAAHGVVNFNGMLRGGATGGFNDGQIGIEAQSLGDFAALNLKLNDSGFFGARIFDIKQGDLTVGNEVRAHTVSISVDGGSLMVNGTIDASGDKPGTIRLSARDDLTLASTAILDAHGSVLQTDSYGAPIEANNTAHVELTTTSGTLTLSPGATIDMRVIDPANRDGSGNAIAYGHLELNAPRLGSTGTSATSGASVPDPNSTTGGTLTAGTDGPANALGNDIAVSATGPLNIEGASSIALNAFAIYKNAPVDPNDPNGQLITQGYLDLIDRDSQTFISNIYAGNVAAGQLTGGLQAKIAGLLDAEYNSAFHVRPGVEIQSKTPNGNLTTSGDIDLSGYRYGPNVTSVRGSGEPGKLVVRAGGNLNIKGSINDGFAPPPDSPDSLIVLTSGTLSAAYTVPVNGAVLGTGSKLPQLASNSPVVTLSFDLTLPANFRIIRDASAAHPIPIDLTLAAPLKIPQNRIINGYILGPDGSVLFKPGDKTPAVAPTLPIGSVIKAGNYLLSITGLSALTPALTTWPAGTDIYMLGAYTFTQPQTLPAGTVLPAGSTITSLTAPGDRKIWATSAMLAPGTQSWSMRLVGGADLASADSRTLQTSSNLAGTGNVVLNDPFKVNLTGSGSPSNGVSVVRTGTGDLEILAGGNYTQSSPFGVYTAGTAIAETGTPANSDYNPERSLMPDGTVLGAANPLYESTLLNSQFMYYSEHGGDFLLTAQGDINGNQAAESTLVGGWLWRQGGAGLGQVTSWGINFGSYTADLTSSGTLLKLSGFSGMGTLGGGNVTVSAGHDIGNAGKGIVVAVGGSGRVIDGQLVQTGGGTLSISAGSGIGGGDNQFVNLRGNIGVQTGDFGSMNAANFGYNINDPRPLNLLVPYAMTSVSGGSFVPGDGVVDVRTRGDLAVGPIIDPGRVGVNQPTKASTSVGAGAGVSWFTLWTEQTAIDLFAAGGDLTTSASIPNQVPRAGTSFAPSILQATAANGSIYTAGTGLMLPSPSGQLELLARGSIIEQEAASGVLASSPSSLATPFNPGWALLQSTGTPTASGTMWSIADSNYWSDPNSLPDVAGSGVKVYSYSYDTLQNGYQGDGGYAFVFGPNNVTDDSAFGGSLMSRIYAVDGDVYGLAYGSTVNISRFVNGQSVPSVAYYAAKPVRIFAGGDIVNVTGLILQNDPTDVSMIAAQGSVIYPTFDIAGPGTFEVTAGKNIYFGATASIESIGPKVIGDTRPGASVVLQGGLGAGAPGEGQVDWTGFAKLYLDPVNLAGAGPLADQPGKVAKTYNSELLGWLKTRFGYAGSAEGALAYFLALPGEQQRVFLRMVYYAELTAGGREYNAIGGPRYGSYLRGREAIAMLFDAGDEAYGGDITLFSARIGPGANPPIKSGFVHTDFGGDIQLLAPAGGVTIGTEGLAPGADAGLITQGEGNIQIYSQDSVLLGLSRIMTTFGGDILAWSAEGDINAGRGSKTTTIFTPPKREYDNYGNIKLSPTVPSQGAGIATLNPIPDVPPGDIDLIAPLGTIDAGEAGIRVSGNVNLAALHIVNAANIQVQGTSSGIPTVQAPNIGGLTEASNTAGAAAQQAAGPKQSNNAQPSIIIVEVLGFGGGEGASPSGGDDKRKGSGQQTYNTNSPFQVVGAGSLNQTANRYLTESEKVALRQ